MSERFAYLAGRVFVHRWPHDTPEWPAGVLEDIERDINKNPGGKRVAVGGRTVAVEGYEFGSIKKLGISVPFFKDDCRMIFEGVFGGLYAHVHVITDSGDYLEVFNRLAAWKRAEFPG